VEDKILKKKILVVVYLLSITIFAGNAYSLTQPPGTISHFMDTINPTTNPWTHILTTGDFYNKSLGGTEPLIIERARLFLSVDFTPELVPNGNYVFKAKVKIVDADTFLTKLIKFSYSSNNPVTDQIWTVSIPDSLLGEIADKSLKIKIITKKGTLDDVNFSTLKGTLMVAPEPISMVLVGVGIAGLPVAGRIRSFISKG
jgi:hypothetical protein